MTQNQPKTGGTHVLMSDAGDVFYTKSNGKLGLCLCMINTHEKHELVALSFLVVVYMHYLE